jgi:histone H2A
MLEAASRVPDTLYDKSPPPPPAPIIAPVHKAIHDKQNKKLKSALARTGSLDSMASSKPKASKPAKLPTVRSARAKMGKAKAAISGGKTRSSRAGLLFPVGRIKRKLKELMVGQRVGVGSSIYLAATLEYLTAELLEIAGNDAKNDHKKRITPMNIKRSLKSDDEMNKMLQNVTIGLIGE